MFLNKLVLESISDSKYILKDDLVAQVDGKYYTVPKGFITDLASVPYPLNKWIKSDNSKYLKSAVMHDFFYVSQMDRKKADDLFLLLMESENTPRRYKYSFYLAVRLFGWIRYKKGN